MGKYLRRLIVRHAGKLRLVEVDEIDRFEAAENYVRLHVNGTGLLVRATMKALEKQLAPGSFARIHRSHIVNLDRVSELLPRPGGDYEAKLRTGERLPVSRTYREEFERRITGWPT